MSYAMLLEEYDAEHAYENTTFASIAEGMNSLIDFVQQDITVDFSVSLEAANDVEALKEASVEALKNAAKKFFDNVKKWVPEILKKIGEIAQKAAIAVMNKGNKAILKFIKDGTVTKRDINVSIPVLSNKEIQKVINALGNEASAKMTDAKKEAAVNAAIANAKKFELIKDENGKKESELIAKGTSAKAAYEKYCKFYIDGIDYKSVETQLKSAVENIKREAAELEKSSDKFQETKNSLLYCMKATTALTNFEFQVLAYGVGTSAKIAAACIGKGEKAEGAKEEKKEEK